MATTSLTITQGSPPYAISVKRSGDATERYVSYSNDVLTFNSVDDGNSYQYTILVTDNNGCSDTKQVSLSCGNSCSVNLTNDCNNNTVTVSGSIPNAPQVAISFRKNGVEQVYRDNLPGSTFNELFPTSGNATYSAYVFWQGNDVVNCTGSVVVNCNVPTPCTPIVGLTATAAPTSVAPSGQTTLNATATSGLIGGTTTYSWKLNNNQFSTSQSPVITVPSTQGTYQYSVTATNANGEGSCSATATVPITVSPYTPVYTGFLDEVTCYLVRGWAADTANKATVFVDIYIDGVKVANSLLASVSRPDVAAAIGSNANDQFGYSWDIPLQYQTGTKSVDVKIAGTNQSLIGSPKSYTCPNAGCTAISGFQATSSVSQTTAGSTVTLDVTANPGSLIPGTTTYSWKVNGQQVSTSKSFTPTVNATTTYTVRASNGDACIADSEVTVTVPTAQPYANLQCTNNVLTTTVQIPEAASLLVELQKSSTQNGTYTKIGNSLIEGPVVNGTYTNNQIDISGYGAGWYRILARIPGNDASTIYSSPVQDCGGETPCTSITGATINTTGNNIAPGTPITLSVTGTAGIGGSTSYVWSNGATSSTITVSPTQNTTYSVALSNGGNCSANPSINITVTGGGGGNNQISLTGNCSTNGLQVSGFINGATASNGAEGGVTVILRRYATADCSGSYTETTQDQVTAPGGNFSTTFTAPGTGYYKVFARQRGNDGNTATSTTCYSVTCGGGCTAPSFTLLADGSPGSAPISGSGQISIGGTTTTINRGVNTNIVFSAGSVTGSATLSYSWNYSSNLQVVSGGGNSSTLTVKATSGGSYFVELTISNGCGTTTRRIDIGVSDATISITGNCNTGQLGSFTGSYSYPSYNSVQVVLQKIVNGSWVNQGSEQTLNSTSGTFSFTGTGSGTYRALMWIAGTSTNTDDSGTGKASNQEVITCACINPTGNGSVTQPTCNNGVLTPGSITVSGITGNANRYQIGSGTIVSFDSNSFTTTGLVGSQGTSVPYTVQYWNDATPDCKGSYTTTITTPACSNFGLNVQNPNCVNGSLTSTTIGYTNNTEFVRGAYQVGSVWEGADRCNDQNFGMAIGNGFFMIPSPLAGETQSYVLRLYRDNCTYQDFVISVTSPSCVNSDNITAYLNQPACINGTNPTNVTVSYTNTGYTQWIWSYGSTFGSTNNSIQSLTNGSGTLTLNNVVSTISGSADVTIRFYKSNGTFVDQTFTVYKQTCVTATSTVLNECGSTPQIILSGFNQNVQYNYVEGTSYTGNSNPLSGTYAAQGSQPIIMVPEDNLSRCKTFTVRVWAHSVNGSVLGARSYTDLVIPVCFNKCPDDTCPCSLPTNRSLNGDTIFNPSVLYFAYDSGYTTNATENCRLISLEVCTTVGGGTPTINTTPVVTWDYQTIKNNVDIDGVTGKKRLSIGSPTNQITNYYVRTQCCDKVCRNPVGDNNRICVATSCDSVGVNPTPGEWVLIGTWNP